MDYHIEEVIGKNNLKTLKVNGYFLHSKYNPINEAKSFAEKHYEAYSNHILIGYGAGYIVDEFLSSFQHNEKLILVDPLVEQGLLEVKPEHQANNKVMFFKSSEMKYFTDFLRGSENVVNQIDYQICCSLNYDKLFEKLHVEIFKQVKELLHSNILKFNTLKRDTSNWLINVLYNFGNMCGDSNLNKLQQVYDAPVVIASGGPSLTKQLALVKENRENIILIAAGSTINSLLKEGIEPDYVVVVDGSKANERHFKNLSLSNANVIYSPRSSGGIRQFFKSNGYCFVHANDGQIKRIIRQNFSSDLPVMIGGGTVAHYSLSIASYISSGPIALIGQDLAYTDMKSHADGNANSSQIIDTNSIRYMYTEGYYGEKILTDIAFNDMKKDFEKLIEILNIKDRVFNCTEGGAFIEGYKQIPFQLFVEQYVDAKKISLEQAVVQPICELEIMNKYLTSFLTSFELIKKEVILGEKLLKNKKTVNEQLLRKIKKINKKLFTFIDEYPLDIGFEQLSFEGSRVFNNHKLEDDESERIINFTVAFYNRCLELYELLTPHLKILIGDLEKRA